MIKKHDFEKGFTLVELLIATTVFSVILLLCTYGIISVGRTYYKGVTITRTQEVARNIMDDITQAIQFSGGSIQPSIIANASIQGFCIADRRYSYIINDMLDDVPTDHAFVVDKSGQPCAAGMQVQTINQAVLPNQANSKEMLLPNMRVLAVSVQEVSERQYRVSIKIASGDNASLEGAAPNLQCRNRSGDSQYCAVTELTSIVQKRLE